MRAEESARREAMAEGRRLLQELQQAQDEKALKKEEEAQARHDRLMGLTPQMPVAPSRMSQGVAPSPRRRQIRSISFSSYSHLMGNPMQGEGEGEHVLYDMRVFADHIRAFMLGRSLLEAAKQIRWLRNCGGVLLLKCRSLSSQHTAKAPARADTRARRAAAAPTVKQPHSSTWGKCAAGSGKLITACTSTVRHQRWTMRQVQRSRHLMSQ